jgi:predicted ATP-dependent serine protease
MTMEIAPRKHIMSWLQEGTLSMIFGPRGVGKTYLSIGLAVALASGSDFLSWETPEPAGVLVVDGEMALDDLRQRVINLSGDRPPTNLFFLTSEVVFEKLQEDLVLTQERWREAVVRTLDAHPEIKVLILDNVSTLFSGLPEDKKNAWEMVNAWLISLRHRKLAVVMIHHAGKTGQQRGTSAREDVLDVVISLELPADHDPEQGCKFDLRFTKNRSIKGDAVRALSVELREGEDGALTWSWQLLTESHLQQVADLLKEGLSGKEIAEELGISRGYVSKLKGKIETPPSG